MLEKFYKSTVRKCTFLSVVSLQKFKKLKLLMLWWLHELNIEFLACASNPAP